MKTITFCISLLAATLAGQAIAGAEPKVYINENLGFNVEGYKYTVSNFPCDMDKYLVSQIVKRGNKRGLAIEAVSTADKIRNGTIPVVAIDVEQLVLGNEEHTYGTKSKSTLPKVQVTAAVIKGDDIVTAKHTCAIVSLNEFTPATSVLDLGTSATVCSATRKCLKDLSNDIVDWVSPQVK